MIYLITFFIPQGSPLFAIRQRRVSAENTEGTIFLVGPLDFEAQSMYHLTLLAVVSRTLETLDSQCLNDDLSVDVVNFCNRYLEQSVIQQNRKIVVVQPVEQQWYIGTCIPVKPVTPKETKETNVFSRSSLTAPFDPPKEEGLI